MDELKKDTEALELTDRLIQLINTIPTEKKHELVKLLQIWQRKEQRENSRVNCMLPVDYSTKDRVYRDFIQNLGNGGVFIETKDPLSVGKSISLTFSIPISQNHYKITGKIVRGEKNGFAVQFSKKLNQFDKQVIKASMEE